VQVHGTAEANCTARPVQLHAPIQHHSGLMDAVLERAPAKINLVLRVGPRRPDGYHEIVSLMAQVDLADTLTLARAARTVVDCPGLAGGDTLVTRALAAFCDAVEPDGGPGGFHAVISKRIPAGAGLGGGSSDAAAALRAANRLYGTPLTGAELSDVAATIGSDVPFFLGPAVAIARGRGVQLEPGPALPPAAVVLAHPGRPLATRDVYEAYRPAGPTLARELPRSIPSLSALASLVENDLGPVAERLEPACAALRVELVGRGAAAASVTGSGSAVFGLFGDLAAATVAAESLPTAAWARAATLQSS
jgi:4-diphosphocytidyl-2-C-methyl-D-erythritol kinase